jgi:hypothetical protein
MPKQSKTDYHDGENVTNYLGNEDYVDGANVPERHEREQQNLSGKVAWGNDLSEEEVEDGPSQSLHEREEQVRPAQQSKEASDIHDAQ